MSRTIYNRFFISMALLTSLALLVWIAGTKARAQNTLTGDWTATVSKEKDKLQLNMERRSDKGGRNNMGQPYDFSQFQGLTREQATNGGPVSFSLVREAGRIDFEGSFQNGKGSGTFRFTGNEAFVSAMKSRGFTISAGYGSLKDTSIRIGHMGDHTVAELDVLLETLREVLTA